VFGLNLKIDLLEAWDIMCECNSEYRIMFD
jgi:hypothetical protein